MKNKLIGYFLGYMTGFVCGYNKEWLFSLLCWIYIFGLYGLSVILKKKGKGK